MKVGLRLGRAKVFLFIAAALFSGSVGMGEARADQTKSWSAIASTSDRFTVLNSFGNEAVLDRETGLVWSQKPVVISGVQTFWPTAASFCPEQAIGGRYGWRLPTQPELASLLVVSGGGPSLPAGHPFVFHTYDNDNNGALSPIPAVQMPGTIFFTSSTLPRLPNFVSTLIHGAAPGQMIFNHISKDDFTPFNKGGVWCVRGGSGFNGGI